MSRDLVGKIHEVDSACMLVNLHWLFMNTGPCLSTRVLSVNIWVV